MLVSELKNIPISSSILHEQEYHNLCRMLQQIKRRAFTERRSSSRVKEEVDRSIANIQTTRLEVVA
jgi:hypothetical protein